LDRLAKIYECNPVDNCSFDLNGDGVVDKVKIITEPKEKAPYHSRVKIYVSEHVTPDLNIENVHVDNTYRTHLAYIEENNLKKIVIYDTVNTDQFFHWNGSTLSPSSTPSYLEKRVRAAMAIGDDTGGFHTRIIFEFGFFYFSIVYYVGLVLSIVIFLFWRRSRTKKL